MLMLCTHLEGHPDREAESNATPWGSFRHSLWISRYMRSCVHWYSYGLSVFPPAEPTDFFVYVSDRAPVAEQS